MNNKKMTCRLINCVITNEGDFIPAGMLVDVLQWSHEDELLYVRTHLYMYADSAKLQEWSNHQGFIHDGLIIKTSPENLIYHSGL